MMSYVNQILELALQNKYTKWYCGLITRAQQRATTRSDAKKILGYTEKHHILPKSFKLGGDKDKLNYAYLTAREHLVCHLLLTKMFTGSFKIKMCFALHSMYRVMKRNDQLELSSWEYQKIKEANSYARSNSSGGMKNKKHRQDSIELMRINANGFKKGCIPHNKGKKEADDLKEKRLKSIKKYRDQNPEWDKNWQEGRKRAEPNRIKLCSKSTEVDGIIYPSATTAANTLGLKKITLIKRVKSPNFPTYKYVENS